jgi:hypothetical protein
MPNIIASGDLSVVGQPLAPGQSPRSAPIVSTGNSFSIGPKSAIRRSNPSMISQRRGLLHFLLLTGLTGVTAAGYLVTGEAALLMVATVVGLASLVPLARFIAAAAAGSPSRCLRVAETIRAYIANEAPSFQDSIDPR